MTRSAKTFVKRALFALHKAGLRAGLSIMPQHYYSPVANLRVLKKTMPLWAKKSELPGIATQTSEQLQTLRQVCLPFQEEYRGNEIYRQGVNQHYGPGYGYIEAQALYAAIRHWKPAQIIEVGSGVSTFCAKAAADKNTRQNRHETQITCIEPYPSQKLMTMQDVKVLKKQVQEVEFRVFEKLQAGDLLFIDSSHSVKPGSDVNYLILEVLPRLAPGVVVHFHDIYLPYDYPRDVLKTYFHWQETSLLRAFLMFNSRAKILFSLSMLHYEHKQELREIFPEYEPQPDQNGMYAGKLKPFQPIEQHFPSSLYLQM